MRFITEFIAYLQAVFTEGKNIFLSIFDVIGIILFFSPYIQIHYFTDPQVLQKIGIGIFIVSYTLANFNAFRKLFEINAEKANIILKVEEIYFNPKREHKVLYGFVDETGMPEYGSIFAKIVISNIGYEVGNLEYQIDEEKANVPAFLDKNGLTIYQGLISSRVEPRRTLRNNIILHFPINIKERQKFSEVLKKETQKEKKYAIPLIYWTERVDGNGVVNIV